MFQANGWGNFVAEKRHAFEPYLSGSLKIILEILARFEAVEDVFEFAVYAYVVDAVDVFGV